MKLTEVFAQFGIHTDEKSRRILNTSQAVANVTASEIEDGISLERLETIGVPVYRYATQITLHGVLPGFSREARPAGFKSVFRNANGTIGVKYVAIDGAKKATIADASHYGHREWSAHLDSAGLTIGRHFEQKDEALESFKSFPRELIHGSVQAGAGVYGGFWVLAWVGAIPEANVWPLIARLWGVASNEDFDALKSARAAEAEQRRQASANAAALRDEENRKKRAELAAVIGLPRLQSIPAGECQFVRIAVSLLSGGVTTRLYTVKRRGPVLCVASRPFGDGIGTAEEGKFRKLDAPVRQRFEADCRDGFVFAAPTGKKAGV